MELKNSIALVTGGASGLGQATVEEFVSKGAKAVILDINEDNAKKIIDNLGEDNVLFISTNIMEEEPVVNAVNQIKEKFGDLRKTKIIEDLLIVIPLFILLHYFIKWEIQKVITAFNIYHDLCGT